MSIMQIYSILRQKIKKKILESEYELHALT